jgi:hypothetical protein
LIENGADVNIEVSGESPLDVAKDWGYDELIEMLSPLTKNNITYNVRENFWN